MQYILLLYRGDEDGSPAPEPESPAFDETVAQYFAFTRTAQARGIHRGGEALQPSATATTVRVRGGKTLTTDGPAADTPTELGGFYLLDCENLDEALECAARIPLARRGAVEVRPVLERPAPAGDEPEPS